MSPVSLGQKPSQKEDDTPPVAYGAGEWKKGDDGMWESTATSVRTGKAAGKKYAIKGERTGEWMVAHVMNTREKMTRREIQGCLKQMDFLQEKWPLRIRPELAVGNWDRITGKDSGGFTMRANTNRDRYWYLREHGMDQVSDTLPVGNHVIYMNASPFQMKAHRKEYIMSPGFLSPSYDKANDGFEYTVAHEYGHLREWQGLDPATGNKEIMRHLIGVENLRPPSRYAETSLQEAQAETFAHWAYEGAKDNEWTRLYGQQQGWQEP